MWTLGDNAPVSHLMEELGAKPGRVEGGVQEFRVPLPAEPSQLEGTPTPLILRAVAEGKLPARVHEDLRPKTRLERA